MKSSENSWKWLLMPLAGVMLSGCGGGGGNIPATPPANTGSNHNPPAGTTVTVQIDATAGGFGAGPGDPANKYTYFNFDTGREVDLDDASAVTSGAWHIAFKRTSIRLNGGVSGPGAVQGAIADAQNDFYDAVTGEPNVSVFTNATADSELAAFDAVTSADGLTFEQDRYVPYIRGDGTSEGWWLYAGPPTHAISANPDQWWLVRSAAADSYAKFHVTDIVQPSRDITLELFIQGAADSAFPATPTAWTAAIGASGGSKCFDIDSAAEVNCASPGWDIKVEVAGRDWKIWTNGGVSGSGGGGAFGPFDTAAIAAYASGTVNPGGVDITGMYRQDSAGGLFKDNTWYAYNILKVSPPVLWPNYRVYVIDTGSGFFKLQLLSYYDQAGVSGNYTVRYAPVTGGQQ